MNQLTEGDAVFFTNAVQIEFFQHEVFQHDADRGFEECWKLPLSLQAQGALLRLGWNRVARYSDFIDFDECKRWYLDDGLRYSRNWLRELGLSFEIDGIDFAELDAPCQFLLFTHLRFIENTAARMVAAMQRIECFYIIQGRTPLEHEFYFDSDVAAAVLYAVCERLGRRIEMLEMDPRPRYQFPQFASRPITGTGLDGPRVKALLKRSGVSRIGFAAATVANARSIFESLREVDARTILFPSLWSPGLLSGEADELRLSSTRQDWSDRVAARLKHLYQEFCRSRVNSTLPDVIIRNPRLDYQFEYVIQRRWLAYANMIHAGKQIVRDIALKLFVHSDHFTAESAVLSRLYRKQGTKILIVLHSNYPCDRNWASWHRTDLAIAPSKSAAARLRQISGIQEIFQTGELPSATYKSLRQASTREDVPAGKKRAGGRKILLIITNALELDCVPFVDLKAHFEAVSSLARIADQLRDRVVTTLRTKPGWCGEDPDIYREMSGFIPERLDSMKGTTFSECIQIADCIVGVNLATGGYYEILQRGAPLIHFQNADVVSRHPDLPAEAHLTITEPDALRPAIEAILFDDQHCRNVVRRQRDFATKDLASSVNDPGTSIASIVQRLVEGRPRHWWWSRKAAPESNLIPAPEPLPDLSSLQVSENRGAGSVDDILCASDGRGLILGWAGDLIAGRSAKAVHLFVNERWVAKGTPAAERPDVALAYARQEFHLTGFSLPFRLESTELVDELQVYAELDDGTFHRLARSFAIGSSLTLKDAAE